MVQPRGDRRRKDRPGTSARAQEDRRGGDRRVPPEQGDPVARPGPLEIALASALNAHGRAPLSSDPIEFAHRYRSREDIEAAAFVAASFAFGNVAQIRRFLERLFAQLSPSPHDALAGPVPAPRERFVGMRHRFISDRGLIRFLGCLRSAYLAHGSLEALYRRGVGDPRAGTREELARFLQEFRSMWGPGLARQRDFLFPDPRKGSACKRHNLFLRWMVRGKDGVDLGIWTVLSPRDLVVPLDTHMVRMGRLLGLTRLRSPSFRMAEEITGAFRSVCPEDPVKFDYALT
ncbi:MAG: TIGR02757 family protein, partial [Deltaproteobacteria bacterium]|nr:TIGR02757 family protein [Candidatus Deferrimicrobiaceae bacterium]